MTNGTDRPSAKDHALCFSRRISGGWVVECMLMPRLYVSGPMAGYPEHNFPAFEQAAVSLRKAGYRVVSPHELGAGLASWEEYLRRDVVEMMNHADAVATLPELPRYKPSRGRKIETDLALALGWQVKPVEEWLSQIWFCEARPDELSFVL